MSTTLPPLPESFGNPAVAQMAEIVPAAGIDWLPQTPGWYVVAAVLLYFLGRRALRAFAHWHRNRYRREALGRLHQSELTTRAVNETLKLAAMAASSRDEVARLSGTAWTEWLQRRCDGPVFSDASLEELGEKLYVTSAQPAAPSLVAEARTWLKSHRDAHA
ncbi:MAG: DUF4381 domain-containing protein [Pseudomonadota bacterium]